MKADFEPPRISKTGPLTSADLVRVLQAAAVRWRFTALRDRVYQHGCEVRIDWKARYQARAVSLFAFWRRAK